MAVFSFWLLDEFFYSENVRANRCPGANVAVFGRRTGRLYAEGNNASRGRLGGETTNFNEICRIGDDVIGGKRDDDRVVGALGRKGGASRNCGPGIAAHRFEQDVGFGP